MNLASIATVVCLAATCTGCATWSTNNADTSSADSGRIAPTLAARSAVDVRVTDGDVADQRYVSLGDITVTVNKTTVFHSNPTREQVNEKLREKAAELGADAVIFVRYGAGGMSLVSWNSLEGKGRAIKFVK